MAFEGPPRHSWNEQLTPAATRTTEVVGISPLTVANAAQDTNNGNVSPVGSTGTMRFADHLESESSDVLEPQSPAAAPMTPKKTVLPDDYDATSDNTPPGFEDTSWREHNARLATARPLVPGHTSTPSKWPGPFYVDTPPSSK